MNHLDNPNVDEIIENYEVYNIANRDIEIGEEITCNYKTFDLDFNKKIL